MRIKFLLFSVFYSILFITNAQQINWEMGMNISSNAYGNLRPRVVLDSKNNAMVIWSKNGDKSVYFSKYVNNAFTTPVKLNPSWMNIAAAYWMGPEIAAKGDTVYVVMKRIPESSDTNHVYIVSSFNGGETFNPPVRVDYIDTDISRFTVVEVDQNGNPIVAFMRFDHMFMDSRWVVTKSTDYGQTFSADVLASGYSGTETEACDCCPGALAVSGNTVAMLYRDNLNNLRDIWAGISYNNAATFNTGFDVDKTKWNIPSCPSTGPDGVIVNDTLYTTFASSASGNYRVFLNKSTISNQTHIATQLLTGDLPGLTQQNYPRLSSDGKALAVVWKQNVSGAAQLPILFKNDLSKPFNALEIVDVDNITTADVAIANGNIFVVWQDDLSATVKFRKGTYNQTSGMVNFVEPNQVEIYPNPASRNVFIKLNQTKNTEVIIYNNLGKQVLKNQLTEIETNINLNELTPGLYTIQVNNANFISTKKLLIN